MAGATIEVLWHLRDRCWYARGLSRPADWVKVSHGHPGASATDAALLAGVRPLFGMLETGGATLRRLDPSTGCRRAAPRRVADPCAHTGDAMSDDTSTPPPDDDQPTPAEALAAAMATPRLCHPDDLTAAALAAFLALPEPGTTVH